jgi:hypothetical protein
MVPESRDTSADQPTAMINVKKLDPATVEINGSLTTI